MAVVIPQLQDSPTFDGVALFDSVDSFALGCASVGTGVISGMAVTQDTGSDMKVAVATGGVMVQGISYPYTGTGSPFTIGAASTFDRRDLVVYRVGTGVVVIAGTPCATAGWTRTSTGIGPMKPALTVATDCPLAEVYVASATTTITTAANVVDKRYVLDGRQAAIRATAFQSVGDQSGIAGASAIPMGAMASPIGGVGGTNTGTRLPVLDAFIGDSIPFGTTAIPGVTDVSTYLSEIDNRENGLRDNSIGFLRATGWSGLGAGAATPATFNIASVTLGGSATVTASAFNQVTPGMSVSFVSGTGSLTAGTYVVSVSGTNCVLNQAPASTGTATLAFGTGPIGGPTVSPTSWQVSSSQTIADGVTAGAVALTVASVSGTGGTNTLTVTSGGFPGVVAGMLVSQIGNIAVPTNCFVRSVSGNTLIMTGNLIGFGILTPSTVTFTRFARRIQVFYSLVNNGDNVTFTAVGGLGGSSGSLSTHNPAGGIGMWDSGDLGHSGAALLPVGVVAAGGTHSAGAGGGGVTVLGVRYLSNPYNGVSVDNFCVPATAAISWAANGQANGQYQSWAQMMAFAAAQGTPYRRLYVECGTNDASIYRTGPQIQANYQTIAAIANAVSPSTEVVMIAQYYGDAIASFASVTTISGSPIISSANFTSANPYFPAPATWAASTLLGVGIGSTGSSLLGVNTYSGQPISGSAVYAGSTGTSISGGTTLTGTGFTSGMVGMLATGAGGTGAIPAGTYISAFGSATTVTLSQASTNGTITTLTLTPTVTLASNCSASGTITAYNINARGGPANWATTVGCLATAALLSGSTFVNLFEDMGDLSAKAQVASVTTATGLATVTNSGGWPGVAQGMLVSGVGLPLDCQVLSVSGTTLTMTAPALVGSSQTLTFYADKYGLSNGGLHVGDTYSSQSGRNGHRVMAEVISRRLAHSLRRPVPLGFQTGSAAEGSVRADLPYNYSGTGSAWGGYANSGDTYPTWSLRSGLSIYTGLFMGLGGSLDYDTFVIRTVAGGVRIGYALTVSGLTGSTTLTRWIGGTTGAPPTGGTYAAGDFVHTTTGNIWVYDGTSWCKVGQHSVTTSAPGATPSINSDTTDVAIFTGVGATITSMSTNLTGTPSPGQKLLIRFTGTASRGITWGSGFISSGVATLLPTTSGTKTHMVGLVYDSVASAWVCLAVDATGY